jgi:hypothetical protein
VFAVAVSQPPPEVVADVALNEIKLGLVVVRLTEVEVLAPDTALNVTAVKLGETVPPPELALFA